MEAARAAGVQGILVLTGRGVETVRRLGRNERSVWPVVADLRAAVEHILNNDSWSRPGSGMKQVT